jgi:hypothetical protein
MFDGTSFPAVWFYSAVTPLTRRLLVYFDSGAYTSSGVVVEFAKYMSEGC